jgi:hypothetical protein
VLRFHPLEFIAAVARALVPSERPGIDVRSEALDLSVVQCRPKRWGWFGPTEKRLSLPKRPIKIRKQELRADVSVLELLGAKGPLQEHEARLVQLADTRNSLLEALGHLSFGRTTSRVYP